MNKHVVLALFLCLATVQARLFHDDALTSAARSLLADSCPDGCATGACMPDTTKGGFRCIKCRDYINLDLESGLCVCPPGRYASGDAATGSCVDCEKGYFCLGGTFPSAVETSCDTAGSAVGSPAGGLTTRGKRAKTISACVNSPGYSFSLSSDKPMATVCAANFYGPGLKKQAACMPCPSGFVTTATTKTRSSDCVVPKGYYLKSPGEVAPCPKGEYQDTNSNVGKCQGCPTGVTTLAEGSTEVAACRYVLPTFYPATIDGSDATFNVLTTKKCPQKYYCPGGLVTAAFSTTNKNTGTTTRVEGCPDGLWTEKFGAYHADQCMTPPGHKTTGGSTSICDISKGEYRADWKRAADATSCDVCGENILSETADSVDVYNIADEAIVTQLPVPASTGSCYILPGQGMYYSPTSNLYSAVDCNKDNYGVNQKTNGLGGYACRQCPVNMVASAIVSDVLYKASNGLTSPLACVTQAGYGYNGRIATQCPIDSYNAAGNRLTCTKCPAGRRTSGTLAEQAASGDCKIAEGFGSYGGQVEPCPVGTYNDGIMAVDGPCTGCTGSTTTSQTGALSTADCNLCIAGYGGAAGSCATPCGNGVGTGATYGPTGREATGTNSACLACPTMSLGFIFPYSGSDNTFTPAPVSRLAADSTADCLSQFAQLAPGAWYMHGTVTLTADATATNFNDCAAKCASDDTCVFITYDYTQAIQGDKCKMKIYAPVSTTATADAKKIFTAVKAVQAGDVSAGSLKKTAVVGNSTTSVKGLASGSYTFWHEDGSTWSLSRTAVADADTVQKCLTACNTDALCAGVIMSITPTANIADTSAITSCNMMFGDTTPATFIRSATKADRARLSPTNAIIAELGA